jgi:hypothetical protein
MTGKGCFHSGVCFGISNLAYYNNVGVESKSCHNKVFL